MAVLIGKYIERELEKRKRKYKLEIYFSGKEVLDILTKDNKAPDMLFVAVKMRRTGGIAVGSFFVERYCRTLIFYLSAYEDTLLEAARYKPFACVLKKNMAIELPYFLDKALLRLSVVGRGCVSLNSSGLKLEIPGMHIMYIRCWDKKIYVGTMDNKEYKSKVSLKDISGELNKDFVLINRGVIVNTHYVMDFNGREVLMKRGHVFLCSKRHKSALRKMWSKVSDIESD